MTGLVVVVIGVKMTGFKVVVSAGNDGFGGCCQWDRNDRFGGSGQCGESDESDSWSK